MKVQIIIISIVVLIFVGGISLLAAPNTRKTETTITLIPQMTATLSLTMRATQTISPITSQSGMNNISYDERIAACYPANPECSACRPILNNSIQHVVATERHFVNLPKDFYPMKNIGSQFVTVKGNATASYVSNGGPPGEGSDAASGCYSTYYEFDGIGEVDLQVKSPIKDIPDYFVRFIISSPQ